MAYSPYLTWNFVQWVLGALCIHLLTALQQPAPHVQGSKVVGRPRKWH